MAKAPRTTPRASAKSKRDASSRSPLADDLDDLLALLKIPGKSCEEGEVARFVVEKLLAAGVRKRDLHFDEAHLHTPNRGQVGNLSLQLPGTRPGPRRMLMAHLDTVPICVGSQPVRKGKFLLSANPATGIGADDRSGVAIVLQTALEVIRNRLDHPPLTFLWTVQEEVGLHGARQLDLAPLGKPKLAFNFDGGAPEKLTIGATGGYRMEIEIQGLASHAGNAPQSGISAIAVASLAIAQLVQTGWHGRIEKPEGSGTSNVGVIQGGNATNVVTDHLLVKVEARSHDPKFRKQIIAAIEAAFRRAVETVVNDQGKRGKVRFTGRLDYESFRLTPEEPCVVAAMRAVRKVGAEPFTAIGNGGLDANWLSAKGIPTVSLGCGQLNIHTPSERLDLVQYQLARRIALVLATGAEQEGADGTR